MLRNILFTGVAVMACGIVALSGCDKSPASTEEPDTNPAAPAGCTLIFSTGFGGDLSAWEGSYMVSSMEIYAKMSITTAAAHQGTHSLTTDSNMTALYHVELPANRVESGTAGVEFYLMAQTPGQANFGVLIGQNPGSSGAITPAFGIFFDPSDSIKCMVFNTWPEIRSFTALAPVQADKWYKCGVEVNFTDSTVSFYLDDVPMHTESVAGMMADQSLMGIDRVLVFRDQLQVLPATTAVEGTKPYYVDDIVLYKK